MSEARQRWRVIVARGEAARDLAQREVTTAWEAAFRASGLPMAETDGPTPKLRVAYAAPVPVGMLADREPIDVALYERLRISEVREAIERVVPTGHRLVDLYDVWPGAPTLAGRITAGDYRVTVGRADPAGPPSSAGPRAAAIDAAVAALLAMPRIATRREKSGTAVEVDIRPHLIDLKLDPESDAGGPFDLLMRLRLGGEGGVGRPDEVVAALGEQLGRGLVAVRMTRERVILADGPA